MKELFPAEILQNTTQSHWKNHDRKSRIIYIIILSSMILTLASLPFIHLDITTQSRGIIKTPFENNNLQGVVNAEIIKSDISENKPVCSGDTLVWLKTEEIEEQILRLNQKSAENALFIEDIDALLKGNVNLVTSKYKAEKAQYNAKLSEQKIAIDQLRKEYHTSKTLFEKGVEAKFEHQQAESRYKAGQSQLNLITQQQYADWETEKTRLEYENKDIYSELIQLEKRKSQYYIIAPVSGRIVQNSGLKAGNFISPGQTIAQIASEKELLAECYISPADIGYVSVGQKVKFQMDAFDYQQWGLLTGRVSDISPDIIEINGQPVFKVRCNIDRTYLELSNGYRGNLKKGMTLTGRFYLTRRSLAQLLFDKIDNWMNPKIITQ